MMMMITIEPVTSYCKKLMVAATQLSPKLSAPAAGTH